MRCSFCKSEFEIPRGMTIIQKDGTPRFYCSGKCRKNSEMGRDNKKVKWVLKIPENKAKAEEVKAANLVRQENIIKADHAMNIEKAAKKSAKAKRADAKEAVNKK